MRKKHETPEDLKNEERIAQRLGIYFREVPVKVPDWFPYDYTMCDPADDVTIRRFVEIKCRNARTDQYPDIVLSLHKLIELRKISQDTQLPVYFSVGMTNGTMICNVAQVDMSRPEIGGRTRNTRDIGDIEPIIRIPMDLFYKV